MELGVDGNHPEGLADQISGYFHLVNFMAGLDLKGLSQPRLFYDFVCPRSIQLPTPFSMSKSAFALNTIILWSVGGNQCDFGDVSGVPPAAHF